ncbi:MAG TPA: hypothetical protein VF868_06200 [Bacteroidia bacterium]|jgi:hypothetical protein
MQKQQNRVRFLILGAGVLFLVIGIIMGVIANSEDPENTGRFMLPSVFVIMGLTDILIAIIWSVRAKKKAEKEKWLMENGTTVKAEVISIKEHKGAGEDQRSYYVIHCEWKDNITSETYMFKSKELWEDPAPALKSLKQINVIINPSKPGDYMMDTAFLQSTT